jgi:phosphoribosylamine--glycine ligase
VNVVLVGNGGREAALAYRIARSPTLGTLTVVAPNPSWPAGAVLREAKTPEEIVALARSAGADLVVCGPEAPLEIGLADRCLEAGIPCFGPQAAAARLETSKAFAKEIMNAARVTTAKALVVDPRDPASMRAAEKRCADGRVVVKVDGLAAGKGVYVCPTAEEALSALRTATSGQYGASADRLVLEDLLEGPEVSVFALCDGERVVALPSAQDHKRLLDGDRGPNTGGMGAYAPCPLVDSVQADAIVQAVHLPVIQELARRGTPFRGVLYGGLMMTASGPYVLEFNVRFGDPECQPLMCLWDDDILPWLFGAASGKLPGGRPRFAQGSACCVVVAAEGYPEAPVKGVAVPDGPRVDGVEVFVAGAQRAADGVLRTTGGRVLGVTGMGPDLRTARDRAYAAVDGWRFPGAQVRSDIAAKAL